MLLLPTSAQPACAAVRDDVGSYVDLRGQLVPGTPVDQGVGDRTGLSASFRDIAVDLAIPTGFRDLFRLPSGPGGDPGHFYRSQGAIYAVFPSSAYLNSGGRSLPLVPPDTVFHIGLPDAELVSGQSSRPRRQSGEAQLLRIDDRRVMAKIDEISASDHSALPLAAFDDRSAAAIDHGINSGSRSSAARSFGSRSEVHPDAPTIAARVGDRAGNDPPLPRFVVDSAYRRARLAAMLSEFRTHPGAEPRVQAEAPQIADAESHDASPPRERVPR